MDATATFIGNLAILNAKLRKEAWFNCFWARWAGNVEITKDDNGQPNYKPSGKPIEIFDSFIQEGRDNMLIPFLNM